MRACRTQTSAESAAERTRLRRPQSVPSLRGRPPQPSGHPRGRAGWPRVPPEAAALAGWVLGGGASAADSGCERGEPSVKVRANTGPEQLPRQWLRIIPAEWRQIARSVLESHVAPRPASPTHPGLALGQGSATAGQADDHVCPARPPPAPTPKCRPTTRPRRRTPSRPIREYSGLWTDGVWFLVSNVKSLWLATRC